MSRDDKKLVFQTALVDYLNKAKIYKSREAYRLVQAPYLYRSPIQGILAYSKGVKDLLVPPSDYYLFLEKIERIFESRITEPLVTRTVSDIIVQETQIPYSEEKIFNEDDIIQCSKKIFNILWEKFELRSEIIVPLFNIENLASTTNGIIKRELANTLLYLKRPRMEFIQEGSPSPYLSEPYSHIPANGFLIIPSLVGDEDSQLLQVKSEVERALQVLRFVSPLSIKREGNVPIIIIDAKDVSIYPPRDDAFFYKEEEKLTYKGKEVKLNITNNVLYWFEDLGLENINYHYKQIDNEYSQLLIRALEFYDSGVTALTNEQAMYRYIVAINVAYGSLSKGGEIADYIEKTLFHGKNYIGKTPDIEGVNQKTWEELSKLIAKPFREKFYIFRNQILHGNMLNKPHTLTDEDIHTAQALAHNIIRILAYLAHEHNWTEHDAAIEWLNKNASDEPDNDQKS